jgi:hypothetical protein
MATMRSGLQTWLKQECADKADNYLNGIYEVFGTKTVIGVLVSRELDKYFKNVPTDKSGHITKYMNDLKVKLIDMGLLSPTVNKIFNDAMDKGEGYLNALDDVVQALLINSTEQVVECQCGKPAEPGKFQEIPQLITDLRMQVNGHNELSTTEKKTMFSDIVAQLSKNGVITLEIAQRANSSVFFT